MPLFVLIYCFNILWLPAITLLGDGPLSHLRRFYLRRAWKAFSSGHVWWQAEPFSFPSPARVCVPSHCPFPPGHRQPRCCPWGPPHSTSRQLCGAAAWAALPSWLPALAAGCMGTAPGPRAVPRASLPWGVSAADLQQVQAACRRDTALQLPCARVIFQLFVSLMKWSRFRIPDVAPAKCLENAFPGERSRK